jgi:hypothetical protein
MEELLDHLENLGFYRYEEPNMVTALKILSIQAGSPWVDSGQHQYDDLDAIKQTEEVEIIQGSLWLYSPRPLNRFSYLSREDLYEYLPDGFEQLQSVLATYGVEASNVDEHETDEGDRSITIDENKYLICPAAINTIGVHNDTRWNRAAAEFLLVLNTLLEEAQSQERIYVIKELDEDNLLIAFLSSQMYALILESTLSEKDKPKLIEPYFLNYLEIRN